MERDLSSTSVSTVLSTAADRSASRAQHLQIAPANRPTRRLCGKLTAPRGVIR